MSFRMSMKKTPRCPKCKKKVYFREQVIALGHNWHRRCFACSSCNKSLTLGSQCDRNDKLYCQACYQKAYGARGFRGNSFGSMRFGSFDTEPSKEKTEIRKTDMTTGTKFDLTLDDYEEMAENDSTKRKTVTEGTAKLSRRMRSSGSFVLKQQKQAPIKHKTEEVEINKPIEAVEKVEEDQLPVPTIIPTKTRLQSRQIEKTEAIVNNGELADAGAAFVASAKVLIDVVTVALSDPETRRVLGETMSKLLRKKGD